MNRHEAFSQMKSQIPGFSAEGVMGLLNEYVSAIPADRFYCEVGSFHGLTLVAALHGNGTKAISIDNFSEFGGKESYLQDSIARFALGERIRLLSHDFREAFSRGMIERSSIAVYFYDGAHDYTSQVEGLKLSESYLADGALVVVDDTNWEAPRRATLEWVEQTGSELLMDIVTDDFNTSPFWNGIMVCRYKGHGRLSTEGP